MDRGLTDQKAADLMTMTNGAMGRFPVPALWMEISGPGLADKSGDVMEPEAALRSHASVERNQPA
jgi:hypothetical protein